MSRVILSLAVSLGFGCVPSEAHHVTYEDVGVDAALPDAGRSPDIGLEDGGADDVHSDAGVSDDAASGADAEHADAERADAERADAERADSGAAADAESVDATPIPSPCASCLGGFADCNSACQSINWGGGYCAHPGSTDTARCCACTDLPIIVDGPKCLGHSIVTTGMGTRARMAIGDVDGNDKWDVLVTDGSRVRAFEICSGTLLWETSSTNIGGQGFEYDGHLPGNCRTTATTPQAQTDCGYYSHSTFGFVTNDGEFIYIAADRRTIVVLDGATGALREQITVPIQAYFQTALKTASGAYIATSPTHSSHPRLLAMMRGPVGNRQLVSRSGDDAVSDPPWVETFHYMPPMVMELAGVGEVIFHGNRVYDVDSGALLLRSDTPGQNGGGIHALSIGELHAASGPEVSYSVYGPAHGNPSILTYNIASGAQTGNCFSPVGQLHPHMNSVGNYLGTGDLILVKNRDNQNHYYCSGDGDSVGQLTGQNVWTDEDTQRIDWDGSPLDDVLYITGRTIGAVISDAAGQSAAFEVIVRQSQVYDVWGDGKEEIVYINGAGDVVVVTNPQDPAGAVPIKRGRVLNYDNMKKLTCGLYNPR